MIHIIFLCLISLGLFYPSQSRAVDLCPTFLKNILKKNQETREVSKSKTDGTLNSEDSELSRTDIPRFGILPENIKPNLFIIGPDSEKNPNYIENSKKAYAYFLARIEKSKEALSSQDFFDIHSKLHTILLKGTKGDNTYMHKGTERRAFLTQTILPGKLRDLSANNKNKDHLIYHFRASADEREKEGLEILEKIKFKNSLPQDTNEPLSLSVNIPDKALPKTDFFAQVNYGKSDSFDNRSLSISYPKPEYLSFYISEMSHHLNRILDELKLANPNKDLIIEELASYVQLGAVSHLFTRVNISLTMLETNAILNLIGHPGVYHKYIDVLACGLSQKDFIGFFKDYIKDKKNAVAPLINF